MKIGIEVTAHRRTAGRLPEGESSIRSGTGRTPDDPA